MCMTHSAIRTILMIKTFTCKDSEKLFTDQSSRKFRAIQWIARKRLLYLHSADSLEALVALPGNRLERLKGDRQGQYSIRINKQWRICFLRKDGNAYNVHVIDYH